MSCSREDQHKKVEIPSSWRKPEGNNSRARVGKKGAAPLPKAGRRTPKKTRGKHPSGKEETLVTNPKEARETDEGIIRVSSKVGMRKKQRILEIAEKNDLEVANP